MDKKMLCEALYALPGGVVVRRKKSLLPSLIVMAVGIALVVFYYLSLDAMSNNLASSLILAAGGVLLVGILMLMSRIFDNEGHPALAATGEKLRYEERFFPLDERAAIQRHIDQGDLLHLLAKNEGQVSSIAVAILYSADRRIAAMQGYEYLGFEYRPITGIKVLEGN